MNELTKSGIGHDVGIVSVSNIVYRNPQKSAPEMAIELAKKDKPDPTGFYGSIKSRMVVTTSC